MGLAPRLSDTNIQLMTTQNHNNKPFYRVFFRSVFAAITFTALMACLSGCSFTKKSHTKATIDWSKSVKTQSDNDNYYSWTDKTIDTTVIEPSDTNEYSIAGIVGNDTDISVINTANQIIYTIPDVRHSTTKIRVVNKAKSFEVAISEHEGVKDNKQTSMSEIESKHELKFVENKKVSASFGIGSILAGVGIFILMIIAIIIYAAKRSLRTNSASGINGNIEWARNKSRNSKNK